MGDILGINVKPLFIKTMKFYEGGHGPKFGEIYSEKFFKLNEGELVPKAPTQQTGLYVILVLNVS